MNVANSASLRKGSVTTCMILLMSMVGGQVWAQQLPFGFPQTARQKIALLNDWFFYLDDTTDGFYSVPPTKEAWEEISIPHSLKLTSTNLNGSTDDDYQLTFHRAIGWYKRSLSVEAKPGQKIFLEFEGAHQVTRLWVNGTYVGEHAVGGYTPFHFDITAYAHLDGKPNELVLSVDNRRNPNIPPEGDRYDYVKWGGLYRDVYLVLTDPLHISFPWEDTYAGVYITTPTVEREDATISIRTHVKNESNEPVNCRVINRVIDAAGRVVLSLENQQRIGGLQAAMFTQTGGLMGDIRLWSPHDPYLYRVNTTIYRENQAVDVVEHPLGLRKIELIEGQGFVLNGEPLELIGFNRHQAMLFLGDAVPNSLHWKDAWQFKQMGINSVRLAHYPHDDAFIEACDELGLLVYEEPPTWIGIGGEKWMENLEEATRRMVRNHRNHPSIMMWGAAINHRGPVERLHYACKEEDPTRLTGSNGAPWTGPRYSWVTDVYSPMDYRNMPISDGEFTYLCEHGSSTDGTRYQDFISRSKGMPNMIGVAAWTAHEYQTFKPKTLENSKYPFSVDRVPYPPFYWYQTEMLENPIVYLNDQRVSKDGKVVVFSNCQRVALYQDGKHIETRFPDRRASAPYIDHPNVTFDYDWTGGTLTAKGYRGNEIVASQTRSFPGSPAKLSLEVDMANRPFFANGSDLVAVHCYVLDEHGERVISAENKISFNVEGEGKLIEHPDIDANPRSPRFGVATAYIRSSTQPGQIEITATTNGLTTAKAHIETKPFIYDRIIASAKPIYALKHERIDLSSSMEQMDQGGVGAFEFGIHDASKISSAFLQFGWTDWTGRAAAREEKKSSVFECTYILTAAQPMNWYSGWGQTGNLPYLAIDGVSTKPKGGFSLTIQGLKAGVYELTTYHHARKSVNRTPEIFSLSWSDAQGETPHVSKHFAPTSGDLYTSYPGSKTIHLTANGKDPIKVTFQSIDDQEIMLNGFELTETLEMYQEED